MEALDNKYAIELESIKGAIQSSNLLAAYQESEEEEDYLALRAEFEPSIEGLYERVAVENPLQLISMEKKLCDPGYEGLYLARVLGYAVLRGEVDDQYRYKRPQDHFKDVLLAICNSSNFEYIKSRIGQTIQVGFGLSSDIWITNLIEQVSNKRVASFLKAQILPKYREMHERQSTYARYSRQFSEAAFQSTEFPKTTSELKVMFSSLKQFLLHRAKHSAHNDSLLPNILEFLNNTALQFSREYLEVLAIFAHFYDYSAQKHWLKDLFNRARREYPAFEQEYFEFLESLLNSSLNIDRTSDEKIIAVLDWNIEDELTRYYRLIEIIHSRGYVHDDTIEAVRNFYDLHEGLSTVNECLRRSIFRYFQRLMENLPEESYTDYFELNKTFALYMQLFNNQQFSLDVKRLSMHYIQRLLRKYIDKRGRDYQDIKKFVSHTFVEFGFMSEKEIIELFKTRRRKKVTV
ncbi:MAG TPA: hypothetical protein VI603_15445 [Saprospiraceae bacterium]|nr:hypothetical protein [Saprospiraceae bacterium]